MAVHSLFDENRRQELRLALRSGKLAARKPVPEPPHADKYAAIPHNHSEEVLDTPYYVPLPTYDKQLLKAVLSGNHMSADDALRRGADPNVRDVASACATIMVGTPSSRSYGDTALMIAAKKGDLTMVRELLQFKADVNLDFSYGSCPFPTALSYARDGGYKLIEQELLAAGAVH